LEKKKKKNIEIRENLSMQNIGKGQIRETKSPLISTGNIEYYHQEILK